MIKVLDVDVFNSWSVLIFGLLTLSSFISFYWSILGVFRKSENGYSNMYRILKISSAIIWIYSLYLIIAFRNEISIRHILATALQIFALLLFWRTRIFIREKDFAIVFNKESPNHLVQTGPYRWVRHPFYSAYLLCYFSVYQFTLDPLLLGLCLFMTWIYWMASKEEEEKFLQTKWANDYQAYQSQTGALFPKIHRLVFNKESSKTK